ncbi:MAG: TonB-dependent receptor, partial [bacterium]|nr:TonB-dependent receptor [bacterium]
MSNSYLRIFLVISFLCFTLYGGDKTIDDVVDLSLEDLLNIQVVTASKQAQKASDAPAAIHVVTAAMIENRGYRNLEELLDDIPEIEIQKKAVSEYNNYISFRGISGNEKFIILMDGIRINSATGTPMAVGKNYSLANAQRVEVILGPASALYGVDAFTGIVNIITKRGDEVDGLKITANYGSFGSTENSIVFGKRIKDVSFVVTGQFYHSDEPFFPDIYTEEYAWYNDQYRNNGKVRLSPFLYDIILDTPIQPYETPSKAFFINARLNLKNFEIGFMHNMESHNDSVGGRPEFNIYAKNAIFKASVKSIYGKHQFTTDDGKWAFQSTISLNSYELSPDSEFLNTFTGYRDGYKYESNKTMKAEEQISYKLSKTSSIIAGFSYEDIAALPKTGDLPFAYDRDMSAQLQDLYYIGTNITDKDGKDLTIFQDFYNLEYKNYGAYAQFQTKLFKTAGLTLGGRYDYNTRYGASFNPRAGLVIPASKKLTIKLLYGEAFLAPSPYKAYQHYGAFISTNDPQSGEVTGLTGPFWHLPNPDLKPEKLRSIETNITYYLSEKIALSLD